MVKKIVLIALIICLCMAALLSCSQGASETKGSLRKGESVSGGDASLTDGVNLKDMTVEMQGQDTVITLSFLSGSRNEGISETKLSTVPEYRVKLLGEPARMQVDLNIDYADYAGLSEFAGSALQGIFKTVFSDTISVFFQLNTDVEAQVSEEEANLVLRLTPVGSPQEQLYFAGINAYEEYQQNLIPAQLGLTPTLCENLTDIMMISEPFLDEETANKRAQATEEQLNEIAPGKSARVFSLQPGALPKYASDAQQPEGQEEETVASVFVLNDSYIPMETLVENGKYLCTMPSGAIIYARSYVPSAQEDVEQVVKERLWAIQPSGEMVQFDLPDFYDIEEAGASPDGRYLAILDAGLQSNVLYVLDTQTGELLNLGEEGFGAETTSFVWDTARPVIYAMTGYGSLQLTMYDFEAEPEERISSVEEMPGAESRVQMADGLLYFASSLAGETGEGEIYAVDPATGQREVVAVGMDFTVAQGGNYLAALVPQAEDEYTQTVRLQLVDLQADGEPVEIPDSTYVESYAFSADGQTLYYATHAYEGITEEYPVAILKYDVNTGKSTLIAFSKTGRFVPGTGTGELYVIDYNIQDFNNYYTTYVYKGS